MPGEVEHHGIEQVPAEVRAGREPGAHRLVQRAQHQRAGEHRPRDGDRRVSVPSPAAHKFAARAAGQLGIAAICIPEQWPAHPVTGALAG